MGCLQTRPSTSRVATFGELMTLVPDVAYPPELLALEHVWVNNMDRKFDVGATQSKELARLAVLVDNLWSMAIRYDPGKDMRALDAEILELAGSETLRSQHADECKLILAALRYEPFLVGNEDAKPDRMNLIFGISVEVTRRMFK